MESGTTQEVSVPVLLPNPESWALESGPRFLKGRLALTQNYKFFSTFCNLPSYALLRVTFYVIITGSRRKDATVFCKLE